MTQTVEEALTRVRRAAEEAVAKTAVQLAREAADLTPVRTGRLRGSWQVVESPELAHPLPPAEGGTYGPLEIAAPAKQLRLFVANRVPYALEVEWGGLGRAGVHMASRAIGRLQGRLAGSFLNELGN